MPDQPSQLNAKTMTDALRVLALAKAVKSGLEKEAKAKVRAGMSRQVDFRCRIRASVNKTEGKPAAYAEVEQSVNLCNVPAIVEVIRALGVTPAEFKRKLVSVGKKVHNGKLNEADGEAWAEAWADAEASLRSKLPKVKKQVGGSAGRVNVDVDSIEIL